MKVKYLFCPWTESNCFDVHHSVPVKSVHVPMKKHRHLRETVKWKVLERSGFGYVTNGLDR